MAKRAGVSRDALYKVTYGKTRSPGLDVILGVAAAYGETVEEFMGLTPRQIRDSLAEQLARLTPREQAILEASISALLAQREDGEGQQDAALDRAPESQSDIP